MNRLSSYAETLQVSYVGPDVTFSSISTDTRTLEPGALFIALQGDHYDGHHYIDIAFQKGAVAALVHQSISTPLSYLTVSNTRHALGILAHCHRNQFKMPVIALTGSCGKTTTKEYLHHILRQCGHVLASERSFNNDIGLPLTLLKLNKTHDFVVLEMGANAMGEIAELTHIAKPDVAIILNIEPAHLEGFGSIDNIAQAKAEIFQGLSAQGIAIVNTTFSQQWGHYLPEQRTIYFGQTESAAVSAYAVNLDASGCPHFILSTHRGRVLVNLQLPGLHQVDNALAAAAAASHLNVGLDAIKRGLESLTPIAGRLVMRLSQQGARILDDTYNANPSSIQAGLSVLSHYTNQRMLVLGDMGELGKASQRYHAQIGQWARQSNIQSLLTCGTQSCWAAHAFGEGATHFHDQDDLIAALQQCLNEQYTVLIKGSRSASMEKVVNALTIPAN